MKFVFMVLLIVAGSIVAGLHVSQPALAAGNDGVPAGNCLSVSDQGDEMSFSNSCGHRIFIIYCGDLTYSSLGCGNGPNGGYYTHSRNIDPGEVFLIDRDGQINYGGCSGGAGFGNAAYDDNGDGSYSCNVLK